MWRACACARTSAVAWFADGVSAKSRPAAAAKATTRPVRIFAIATAILNRLRVRIGRVGPVAAADPPGPPPAKPPLLEPSLLEPSPADAEIGRASCRERGQSAV